MEIKTNFELFDTYELAEAECANKNAFICEHFSSGKTLAIHYSPMVKQFMDNVGLSNAELRKTHESLQHAVRDAIRHGRNSGEFNFYIERSGVIFCELNKI